MTQTKKNSKQEKEDKNYFKKHEVVELVEMIKKSKISNVKSQKDISIKMGVFQTDLTRMLIEGCTFEKMQKLIVAFPEICNRYVEILLSKLPYNGKIQANRVGDYNKKLNVYDISVQKHIMDITNNLDTNTDETISFLGSEECDFAVKVPGDAMANKLPNGTIIAVKEISDLELIPFGYIFLIITKDLRLVRTIKKSQDNKNILLSAFNSDYEDLELPKSKIIKLYIVKKTIINES